MVNRSSSMQFIVRVIPACLPNAHRIRGKNWLNHITCKRSLISKVGINEIMKLFVDELIELRANGCLVYDSFLQKEALVKVDLFGVMGDLVAKMEVAGFSSGGWANLFRWCSYCTGTSADKMVTEPKRSREQIIAFASMIENLSCMISF